MQDSLSKLLSVRPSTFSSLVAASSNQRQSAPYDSDKLTVRVRCISLYGEARQPVLLKTQCMLSSNNHVMRVVTPGKETGRQVELAMFHAAKA